MELVEIGIEMGFGTCCKTGDEDSWYESKVLGNTTIEKGSSTKEWVVFMNGKTVSWNTTSLDMKISLVDKSSNLYAFMPGWYPTKSQDFACGSNLVLCAVKVEAKAKKPKVRKRLYCGSLL